MKDIKEQTKIDGSLDNKLDSIITELNQLRQHQKTSEDNTDHLKQQILQLKSQIQSQEEQQINQCSELIKQNNSQILKKIDQIIQTNTQKSNHGLNGSKLFVEKQFYYQDSLLDELFKKHKEIKTLFNMALASILLMTVSNMLHNYIEKKVIVDLSVFDLCFNNIQETFKGWATLQVISYLVIVFVQIINQFSLKIYIYGVPFLMYQLTIYYYAIDLVVNYQLNLGSALIILCEAARAQMKTYSYFRNKLLYGREPSIYSDYIPEFLSKKGLKVSDLQKPKIQILTLEKEICNFTFFILAPTLIYRDEYPRRQRVDLLKCFKHISLFFICIYYQYLIFQSLIVPQQQIYTNSNVLKLIATIVSACVPATFIYMLMFFGLLHCWFNFWAELLRVAERNFYEDWWNSVEFGTYYRKWNIVVHEWLFYYIYIDIQRFSKNRISRQWCQLITFLISALIHELIITYAIGFFYPVLFLMFTGPGIILIRNSRSHKSPSLNVMFWFLMFIGLGILQFLYVFEHHARKRVSDQQVQQQYGYLQFLVPRSIVLFYR